MLGCILCLYPSGGFLNDLTDDIILDHFLDVDAVVHLLEDTALVSVLHFDEVKELKPKIFKFVSVVLEEIEIVSDSRENLIETLSKLTSVFFDS